MTSELTPDQLKRYDRHIVLRDIGLEGQLKILRSKVVVIGVGGLGSPAALYLAAAGIGTIGLIDGDVVELSNLQRQVIHFTGDIGAEKVISAANKMKALNPGVNINTYSDEANSGNILKLIEDYDFVIDCTDNYTSKFLINDACVLSDTPYCHGGVLMLHGEAMTVIPRKTACYRCVFEMEPPEGALPGTKEAGVLGAIVGMLGSIQATETLKYLAGIDGLLTNQFLTFDAKEMDFHKITVERRKDCPVCGDSPTIVSLPD